MGGMAEANLWTPNSAISPPPILCHARQLQPSLCCVRCVGVLRIVPAVDLGL